ncbi:MULTISPECIES: hypothetical protein [unclassified Polaromonas]|jgi:hypothetical protein|uniref:hypothetical protein n=1 Tax=unclassified Polaromonas TaxID=2638319 RepID=UPI000BDD22C6|nr:MULTISPECIES: hypothetical protein [unclassified Polaromonas]OYZ76076.1 MAG: hypothetical protein B7Y09_21865 [Polaromonas sp. 24-63-21]OZA47363.1 MAG: hypothetical protein B7X88_22330 [Polaromonas sp. 17-63-33]
MKTDEAIALEIATLAELAKLVPEVGSCGLQDNSRAVINAQIDVLAYRLTNGQVHDAYMDKGDDDMFLALLHASDWVHDLLNDEDDYLPSLEWRDVVKYADGAELVDERAKAAYDEAVAGLAIGSTA